MSKPRSSALAIGSLALLLLGVSAGMVLAQPPDSETEAATQEDDRERMMAERFLALVEKNPRRGTALDRVYGYHVEHGTLDDLLKRYRDRARQDAGDGAAWMLIGLLEAQRGRDSAAVEAFRRAEGARPADALASYYLGQALVLIGQPEAAAEAFERAIVKKPGRTDLLQVFQALGRIHQRAYHADKALAVWNRLEAAFPDDLRVQEEIASALSEEADPSRALPRFEALAKQVTDPYRKVQFRVEAAELKVRLNRRDEALTDFEALLGQLNPESWVYRDVRQRIEAVFLRNDDQAGLASYYERWLKKVPDDVDAMARLGRTLASQGKGAEARTWLDRAVKRAPSRKELRLALVDSLVLENKFAEAAAQYEEMAKADPSNPDLVRDWGRLLLKDTARPEPQRKAAAAAVWHKLLAARPDDAAIAVLVADLFRQAEMPDDAVALYRRAIELAPDSAQYYEYLGEYFHQQKRNDEARAAWGQIATGKNRTAKNLGRLSEVLAGFGFLKEALAPASEACRLDPDAFDLQLRLAELLIQAERHDDAGRQLDAAAKAADDAEQVEAVFDLRIKADQAADRLGARIEGLKKDLDAGREATADRWRQLARMLEAQQKLPEAVAAAGKAVALDAKSVAAWTVFARIHESTGDFGGAVDAYNTLARIDRRGRTEYLTQVAKLEARLGRRDRALKAGREVIASAAGNAESYTFFAELCEQLGEVEEGLETLRRAVRVNPNDIKAVTTLAEALAREFRTDEAIELYWRAFEKTRDLEEKVGVVAKLADLYLQRNQFDRLITRLEREQGEAKQPRELAICLAQAYQSSGDLGTARAELDRLLAANPRDTALLLQLSTLAEADGDLEGATRYLRQANEIAPTDDGTTRLAQLYLRAGETSEAEAIWTRVAGGKTEPHRILRTIDSLLATGKTDAALEIAARLLRDRPDLWEALYREGVALVAQNKTDEAEAKFQALLAMTVKDDEPSAEVKAMRASKGSRPTGPQSQLRPSAASQVSPLQARTSAMYQVLQVTGLLNNEYYSYGGQRPSWFPSDFGQARMAALGWQFRLAQKQDRAEPWLDALRKERDKVQNQPRSLWDWYYLCLLRQEPAEVFEAARALARKTPGDPEALQLYLASLANRAAEKGQIQTGAINVDEIIDKTPPLATAELDQVLRDYRTLKTQRPDLADSSVVSAVATELKRASRQDDAERFYREAIAAADAVAGSEQAVGAALALATQRGDVDNILRLTARSLQLDGNRRYGVTISQRAYQFEQLMADRAAKKAHADVLKILDFFFDQYTSPEVSAKRLKSQNARSPTQPYAMSVRYRVGKRMQHLPVDFPTPNGYYDAGAIGMLRTAFELYKQDDLLSDLFAHVRRKADEAPEGLKLYPMLALGYMDWWNDDRDGAVRALTRAVETAQADPELRLELAETRAKRDEPEEALALVDAVEAPDQRTMQRRELMALRLAVLAGNNDRARQAAERLFNLRLDATLQLQLATQMQQLGMHDLAEAVLARARRRAGNNPATLVNLMRQYQQQKKIDVAVQVAHQILRQGSANRLNRGFDQDDAGTREAIQVLARSGKLTELIGRVEAQLASSPNSVQLLQTLAQFQRVSGANDKARATLERLAKVRPDDADLQYQIGRQLLQAGDGAGSLPYFKTALTKEAGLFSNRYYEIQNAFQQAGKLEELAQIFEAADLTKMGSYWSLSELVSTLVSNEKSRETGLRLFRKAWKAYPQQRASMLSRFYNDEIWKLPEMYDYAREAIVPAPGSKQSSPWSGLDQVNSWSSGGTVNGPGKQLIEAAVKQNKLDALRGEVEAALKRDPDWSGGRAFLAMIAVRRGDLEAAARIAQGLLDDDKKQKTSMPQASRLFLGQELENHSALLPIVLALYEQALAEDDDQSGLDFEYHPVRRLITLYRKLGRTAEARGLVLKFARKSTNDNYDPSYAAYRRFNSLGSIGRELSELGYPADAVPLYVEALSDNEALSAVQRMYSGRTDNPIEQQMRTGLNQALTGMNASTLPRTVRSLLEPAPGKGAAQGLDLVLLVHPREVDGALIRSLLAESLKASARQPELRKEVEGRLADLIAKHPGDLSVRIAEALFAATEDESQALATKAESLLKSIAASPLEDLSEGSRANARQRAEAAKRLGLWLVARECQTHPETRDLGARLGAHALEAAERQSDPIWTLAMLREWGQVAYDRGDREDASRRWTRMLDLVLASPAGGTGRKAGPQATSRSAITLDRFDRATQVAKLAAERGLNGLSLRAVQAALAGGPPVVPIPMGANRPGQMVVRSNNPATEELQTERQVEASLAKLFALWQRKQVPANEVYSTLVSIVLPDSRPTECILYARPLAEGVTDPRSASEALARWAVRAGKVDDLRARIEKRSGTATASLSSLVLLTQLAVAAEDWTRAREALGAIDFRLKSDTLENSSTLACLAALPALAQTETAAAAALILERATRNLAGGTSAEPLSGLHLALAHAAFKAGRPDEGRKQIKNYHDVLTRTMPNYAGDYSLYYRKNNLQKVATEFARAGQWDEVLDQLGQFVDAPVYQGGDPPLGTVIGKLARNLAALPARERYDRLRAWSLPAAGRASVRVLASFVPEDAPPEGFGKFAFRGFESGVASTASLLIDAAREAGALEELARDALALDAKKVENGETLLILTDIAGDRTNQAGERLQARLDRLKAEKNKPGAAKTVAWPDLLLARAALACLPIRSVAESYTRTLIDHAQQSRNWAFLAHLRRDLAAFQAARTLSRTIVAGADPGLAFWHPATVVSAREHAMGSPTAWWVEAEGYVQHLAGPQEQLLLFDYPLTGRFEFSADFNISGWAEGQVGYGGLVADAVANPSIFSGIFPVGRSETLALPSRFSAPDSFNRMTIQVEPDKVRYLVNGHLFYQDDDPSPTAPWAALYNTRERQSTYRNLRLTGTPEIPRSVPLSHEDRLEGWVSSFFAETQPPRRSLTPGDPRRETLKSESAAETYGWISRDGVIQSRRTDPVANNGESQSRLYYYRPLRPGDALSYEFYCEPGEVMVHPALDRLTFLVEPEGVRLHWITDGPNDEWTDLASGNVIDEPAGRLGPAALPLKPNAWNSAEIRIDRDAAELTLNGVKVYRRVLEPGNSRQFGLFHYRDQTAAMVRNVVLRGDWPESVPPLALRSLTARRLTPPESRGDRRARHDILGETMLARQAGTILTAVRDLPAEERYEMLAQWVLPKDDRDDFRLGGEFTPVDAAPPVASPKASPADDLAPSRTHTGGQLVSPALELVATAKALGRLEELAARLDRLDKGKLTIERIRRQNVAFLAMIRIAQDREAEARVLLKQLIALVQTMPPTTAIWQRMPEQTAHWATIGRPAYRLESKTLGDLMVKQWHAMSGKIPVRGHEAWGRQVAYATRRAAAVELSDAQRLALNSESQLPLWAHVEQANSLGRSRGTPPPLWTFRGDTLTHHEGDKDDLLYFKIPLRGDFEVECELAGFGGRQMHLLYGGIVPRIPFDRKSCNVTFSGRDPRTLTMTPPIEDYRNAWYPYRLVVKDRTYTAYLNGRKIVEETLPADADPWLALHSEGHGQSDLRNLRINGQPTIPKRLELSALPDLTGWLGDYYQEQVGGASPDWEKKGEEIVGRDQRLKEQAPVDRYGNRDQTAVRASALAASKLESLLQYHRPLLEDGSIRYEFYYEPGQAMTHPALDRLAFLLEPAGVKVHWLTDGRYDRTGLAPDNSAVEPNARRGPAALPLKAKDWNQVQLVLKGDVVTLTLNDQQIYERTLEPSNDRRFGLFHYGDETEVRVRRVVYEGDWSKTLPANLGFLPPEGAEAARPAAK